MKKKRIFIISIVLIILIIIGLVTSFKDNARVRAGIEPKYTFKFISEGGSKVTYVGLGYKVVRYVGVSPYEPFGLSDNYKFGSWFMIYENPDKEIILLEEIQEYINDYLENNKYYNYSYSFVDESKNKVIVGLVDNSSKEQDKFISDVFSSCCGSKYINNLKDNNYIEFKESKEVFKGKVIENKNGSIIVKVVDDNSSFNKGDKVVVHDLSYKEKNIQYSKDMILTITFNGFIEETYPPQISAVDISLDSNDYNKK